jgi:hypothetical protein
MKALKTEWEASKTIALKRWGLKAEGIAKGHISSQDLGWQALKAETISKKVRAGFSENILVQSSDYFQAITSWVDTAEGKAFAGVRRSAKNAQGDEIGMIARVHEFGSDSGVIPARPLWKPTYDEAMEWFKTSNSRPDRIFAQRIRRYL